RIVVGAFHVFHSRRNRNCAMKMRSCAGQAFEIRQAVERKVHFGGRTTESESTDVFNEIRREILWPHHFHERQPWIDTRRYDLRANDLAVLENNASGSSLINENLRDRRLGPDLGA